MIRFDLYLFLEFVPHNLSKWMRAELPKLPNPSHAVDKIFGQLTKVNAFMRTMGFMHFDAHFQNILTDGEDIFFTDFGLAISDKFELSEEETLFFNKHIKTYDQVYSIINMVREVLSSFIKRPRGRMNLRQILELKDSTFPASMEPLLKKHLEVALQMDDFLVTLFAKSKLTPYPSEVLEDLIQSKKLECTLQNNKIGFYVGSFDPLHKGHEALANDCVDKGHCDFVIVFAAWGGDSYKTRVDVKLRHDMVFALFKDHPSIIVTKLAPSAFQKALTTVTIQTNAKGHKLVQSKFKGTQFIGIVGSDTALALYKNERALQGFMTGIKVPEKYAKHTLGGLMSIPVSTFIVKVRNHDDLSPLSGSIGKRKVIGVIESKGHLSYSSTAMKKLLKLGKPITHMVSQPVIEIIRKHKLYS